MTFAEKTILGLRFAVLPLVVMPLTVLLIPLGLGGIPSLVYYVLHVALDDVLTGRDFWKQRVSSRTANVWFYAFFAQELIALVLLAMVVSPSLFPSLRASISGLYATWGFDVLHDAPSVGTLSAVAGVIGFIITLNYTITHALVHQVNTFNWYLGYLLLVTNCDSQFAISHIYGHHLVVGTPADVNTAFKGESFYRYFVRVVPGQYAQAYRIEKKRCEGIPMPFALFCNRVTLGVMLTGVWLFAIQHFLGAAALVVFLSANLTAKIGVEAVDYIQHYGLFRAEGEKIGEHHSWDGESFVSSIMMFNQNAHALHHVQPGVPYYELAPLEGAPKLPYGYVAMIFLALIPRLWFRTMNPLVEVWEARHEPNRLASDLELSPAPAI